MLNYIWLFLIGIALIVGIGNDITDEVRNTYRNETPMEIVFLASNVPSGTVSRIEGNIYLTAQQFNSFYGIKTQSEEIRQPIILSLLSDKTGNFLLNCTDETPAWWREMAKSASGKDRLIGTIQRIEFADDHGWGKAIIVFEPIRFVKLKAITQAAIDFANISVEIAIGLIGVMALWLGLIKIAEEAGLVRVLTRLLAPITRRIFPEVPPDHPAIGAIIMNTAANMLGLSNAATPIGLKAMEDLNILNPKVGTATNSMITFLAINTGGLILIPATAMAVRAASGSTNIGIIIATSIFGAGCATITGVLASRILQRLSIFKKDVLPENNSLKETKNG